MKPSPDAIERECPTCGKAVPAEAPAGLCPRCLLAGAMDIFAKPSGDTSPSAVAPEYLQALFPELEIRELLGKGGMGTVYRARQPRLNRDSALKILTCPDGMHDDFALRFEREAQTLARLNHPNIVTIYDFGERDGLFYFLMEFVDGTDLSRLIQSGELTAEASLRIVPQICDALQYAHDEGITHRDIKPANILIGKCGKVRIADFGLAKLIGSDEAPLASGLTMTGSSMGTPHYMAPEQWESPGKVDHRADIYSLGVVFYEMLTGERPAGVFAPPSSTEGVDARLDTIVLHAMEKAPERRYQQASQIKRDVTEVVEKAPSHRRIFKAGWMRGWMPATGAAIAIGLAAFLTWYPWTISSETGAGGRGSSHEATSRIPADRESAVALPGTSRDAPWVNSLGMKFLPVPTGTVLLCADETTEANWSAFIKATGYEWERFVDSSVSIKIKPPDHPIGGVSWHDAKAFCSWLTEKEHREGKLDAGLVYRLPTDREWSLATGLDEAIDQTPKELSGKMPGYLWGKEWPPPSDAVNVGDIGPWPENMTEEEIEEHVIVVDRFEETSPVGEFPADDFGFHDMTGNVAEWVEDKWMPGHNKHGRRVLRGSGWFTPSKGEGPWLLRFQDSGLSAQLRLSREASRRDPKEFLKLSHREADQPVARWPQYGFRIALATAKRTPRDALLPLEYGTLENSLGMHLLPTGDPGKPSAYMSRWETRVRDYEVFVQETGREWPSPSFPQTPDHPAVMVSFADSLAFCEWLTAREGEKGNIPQGWIYRLPSRAEWMEAMLPEDWRKSDSVGFRDWTSQQENENTMDGLWNRVVSKRSEWESEQRVNDGFAYSSPVGSYAGIRPHGADGPVFYDVGGNVYERNLNSIVPSATPFGCPILGNAFSTGHWNHFIMLKRVPDAVCETNTGFRVTLTPLHVPAGPTRESLTAIKALASFEFGSSRYAVFPILGDWEEQKVLAERLGGHLATMDSLEEEERIKEGLSGVLSGRNNEIFLGAVRVPGDDGNRFQWISGKPVDPSCINVNGSSRTSRYGTAGDRLGYRKFQSGIFLTDLDKSESDPSQLLLVEWD